MLYKVVVFDEQGKCIDEVDGNGYLAEADRIDILASFRIPGIFRAVHVGRVDFYTPGGKRVGSVAQHFVAYSGEVIKYTGSLSLDPQ